MSDDHDKDSLALARLIISTEPLLYHNPWQNSSWHGKRDKHGGLYTKEDIELLNTLCLDVDAKITKNCKMTWDRINSGYIAAMAIKAHIKHLTFITPDQNDRLQAASARVIKHVETMKGKLTEEHSSAIADVLTVASEMLKRDASNETPDQLERMKEVSERHALLYIECVAASVMNQSEHLLSTTCKYDNMLRVLNANKHIVCYDKEEDGIPHIYVRTPSTKHSKIGIDRDKIKWVIDIQKFNSESTSSFTEETEQRREIGNTLVKLWDNEKKIEEQNEQMRKLAKAEQRRRAKSAAALKKWETTVRLPLEQQILAKERPAERDAAINLANTKLLNTLQTAVANIGDGAWDVNEAKTRINRSLQIHSANASPDVLARVKAQRDALFRDKTAETKPAGRAQPASRDTQPVNRDETKPRKLGSKQRKRIKKRQAAEEAAEDAEKLASKLAAGVAEINISDSSGTTLPDAGNETTEPAQTATPDAPECVICFETLRGACMAAMPCGHLTCAGEACCSLAKCATCNAPITGRMRIFI